MRSRRLTPLVAACVLATGCGSNDPKKSDTSASVTAPPATTSAAPAATDSGAPAMSANGPRAAVRGYFAALAHHDGTKACGLLTPAARGKALAAVEVSRKRKFKSCDQAVTTAMANRATGSVKVVTSIVTGDRAKVTVEHGASAFDLQRIGGRWLIAGPFG